MEPDGEPPEWRQRLDRMDPAHTSTVSARRNSHTVQGEARCPGGSGFGGHDVVASMCAAIGVVAFISVGEPVAGLVAGVGVLLVALVVRLKRPAKQPRVGGDRERDGPRTEGRDVIVPTAPRSERSGVDATESRIAARGSCLTAGRASRRSRWRRTRIRARVWVLLRAVQRFAARRLRLTGPTAARRVAAVLLAVTALVIAWVTRFETHFVSGISYRTNRFTGRTERLYPQGWSALVDWSGDVRTLPDGEVSKILGRFMWDASRSWSAEVYNGTDWELESLDVELVSRTGTERIYRFTSPGPHIPVGPYSTGPFEAPVDLGFGRPARWRIVAARGVERD